MHTPTCVSLPAAPVTVLLEQPSPSCLQAKEMFNAAKPGYAQPQGRGQLVTFPQPGSSSSAQRGEAPGAAGEGANAPGAEGQGTPGGGEGGPAALLAADPACLLRKEPKEGYMTTHEARWRP